MTICSRTGIPDFSAPAPVSRALPVRVNDALMPIERKRGFSAIGLVRPKNVVNIGGVMRAAHIYDAALVAIQGDRSPVTSCQDTTKAWRHVPVLRGDDLFALAPFDCVPVAVDLVDDAIPLPRFSHPQRAFYIFGPEDGTLGKQHLDRCRYRVMVPTRHCMNLAATVNVVLYDRLAKAEGRQP